MICKKCKKEKAFTEFYTRFLKNGSKSYISMCKKCSNVASREFQIKKRFRLTGKLPRPKSKLSGLSSKERSRKIRLTVLYHYGGFPPKCACCGEKEIKFLAIDHINNDGSSHRKTMNKNGNSGITAFWLLKNGFPDGFQILCHNCNMAKGFWGSCPHKSYETL